MACVVTRFGRALVTEFLKTNVRGGVLLFPKVTCLEIIFQINRQKKLGGVSLRATALQALYCLLL